MLSADAVRAFRPGVLSPCHYGETDPVRLVKLPKETPEVETRIRSRREAGIAVRPQ